MLGVNNDVIGVNKFPSLTNERKEKLHTFIMYRQFFKFNKFLKEIFSCHETRIVEKSKALIFQNSFRLHPHLWS